MKFINRKWELQELNRWATLNSMIVIYGRRRIGKTRLLKHWLTGTKKNKGLYSQAIEGALQLQLDQLMSDISAHSKSSLRPTNWIQFFELIEKIDGPVFLCLDEFPYLVSTDASLPSILQKWWDHRKKKNICLILSGSSQKMMHSIFLNSASPLYGRARRTLKMEPMNYWAFCKATHHSPNSQDSFLKYSLVGGVPKYWEYVSRSVSLLELADSLYFNSGAILENEPKRVLSDEKVEGLNPVSVLEAIGRGAHKPSEISSRLDVQQNSLFKVLAQLLDASLIVRETPFGTSLKDSKKSLYKINDPMLRFWFSVYSGLRSQWRHLSVKEKLQFIHHHASHIFENEVRTQFEGARYWSEKEEFDVVTEQGGQVRVIEVKFSKLSQKSKESLIQSLEEKFKNSRLYEKMSHADFSVVDWDTYLKLS